MAVLELDAAIEFYSSIFGLTVVHEEVNEHAESVIAKCLDRSGPGVQHLAFRVDDVVAASRTLRDKGVRVLHEEPAVGTTGSLINFGHPRDCGGVLIELAEV